MSNPGVLNLVSLTKTLEDFPYRFDIEDNIGEAIHIHYKDFRIDLSVNEFEKLSDQIEGIIEKLVSVKGFACNKFDKVNLVGLAALLPYLREIKEDRIRLGVLQVIDEDENGRPCVKPLRDSRIIHALQGDSQVNDRREQANYYRSGLPEIQTNSERLSYNLAHIKQLGYPCNDERIILFNESNIIRDGGHRAGVLYYLHGEDYEIDVRRLIFLPGKISDTDFEKQEKDVFLDLSQLADIRLKGNEIEIDMHSLVEHQNVIAMVNKY